MWYTPGCLVIVWSLVCAHRLAGSSQVQSSQHCKSNVPNKTENTDLSWCPFLCGRSFAFACLGFAVCCGDVIVHPTLTSTVMQFMVCVRFFLSQIRGATCGNPWWGYFRYAQPWHWHLHLNLDWHLD